MIALFTASPDMQASTIIALLALAFSFGTTMVSYVRTKAQDVQALRKELRDILQRLSAIPRENLDASKKYAGDQNTIMAISQLYGQENALLSRQAAEILRKLPKSMISATEYSEVAMTLQNDSNLASAREFYTLACENAKGLNDEITAIRSLANLDFLTGQPQAGRVKYQQALDVFSKYPGYDQYTQVTTHVLTEFFWSQAEANSAQLSLALQHIDNARKLLATLPPGPGTAAFFKQVNDQGALYMQGSAQAAGGPATTMGAVPGVKESAPPGGTLVQPL
jgi:hypothetical protein